MEKFKIRTATWADAKIIYDFIVGIATYEKMLNEVEGDEQDVYETIFIKNQAEVVIGEEYGIPVGFALFFHNYSTFKTRHGLYLEDLFVLPEKRGCGYGKELFLHLVKIANERNCGRMEWCCLDWNQPSIDFYKKMGARGMSEWTTYRLEEQQLKKLI